MGADSKIEWTMHTFNPWRGCSKVSAGCANCYAEKMSKRNPSVLGVWGDGGKRVVAAESAWREPLKWNKAAKAAGERHRVFCASMADVFEDRAELVAPRVRLFHLISETPHLDWLLLTKRPGNVRRFCGGVGVARSWSESMPPNVWLGVSVEDQARADERIPLLLQTPAAVRFLSCEPLLGLVDLSAHLGIAPNHEDLRGLLSWAIVGGESGPGARPMHPDWARSLRDQCHAAGVAFFFKQWGEWAPLERHHVKVPTGNYAFTPAGEKITEHDGREIHVWPCTQISNEDSFSAVRVGKKAAGRLLDGRTWDEFPEAPAHA